MATQALYRKWRSQTFDEVIGQQHVTQTLQNAIQTNRVAHAYLFTGPRGTGKTSTARILAKAVNCTGEGDKPCNACAICRAVVEGRLIDLIEIDAASNTSVDDIRDLRDKVGFRPGQAQTKFYIIDEVHMLSKSAFNALLKTLEEPPPHVIFVLATTEPEKIPATILSRCQRFDFKRIKVEDIVARLQFIMTQEGLQAEDAALTFIARQAGGSMRDAISLLDQLTAYGQETITLTLARSVLGAADATSIRLLVTHLLAGDAAAGLTHLNILVSDGADPKQLTLGALEYLRGLLLIKHGQGDRFLNLSPEMLDAMQAQAAGIPAERLLEITRIFNQAVKDFKAGIGEATVPQLPLELAFVEAVAAPPERVPPAMPAPQEADASPPPPSPRRTPHPAGTPVSAPSPAAVDSLSKQELRNRWAAILDEVKKRGAK
ncbi:MAG: DNA polymerase III subunit gamma/tau [Anaerolineae bacterium]